MNMSVATRWRCWPTDPPVTDRSVSTFSASSDSVNLHYSQYLSGAGSRAAREKRRSCLTPLANAVFLEAGNARHSG